MTRTTDTKVRIGQVFVSSVSFEHREDAMQISPKTDIGNLKMGVQVEVGGERESGNAYVVIRLQTDDDAAPLYKIRVEMVGVVASEPGSGPHTARDYLVSSGAFMMYPFLREFVANLTARGRFGAVWIRPLNFEALASNMQAKIDRQAGGEKADD